MKILIDNNIMLDVMLEREPFYEDSKKLIMYVVMKQAEGYITANMLTDMYYVLKRLLPKDKENSSESAKFLLQQWLKFVTILPVLEVDCTEALTYESEDLEDNLIIAVMKREGLTMLATRNPKDFMSHELEVYEPRTLIDLIEKVQ